MRPQFFLPVALFSLALAGCYHSPVIESPPLTPPSAPPSVSSVPSSDSPSESKPAVPAKIVEMTADGFSPSTLEISVGTTVEFLNKNTEMHWPASAVHPTHQVCAGFDALKGIEAGKSYSYTFTVAKTCPYHDHINPGLKGIIVVK